MALNKLDLALIKDVVEKVVDEKMKFLPTKDEFYESQDELMGEIKEMREEQSANSIRLRRLEDHPNLQLA